MENFLILRGSEVAVIRAEVATGHIYDIHFELAISSKQEIYSVFEDIQSAKAYIGDFIKGNDKFEFSIFDKDEKFIEIINPS